MLLKLWDPNKLKYFQFKTVYAVIRALKDILPAGFVKRLIAEDGMMGTLTGLPFAERGKKTAIGAKHSPSSIFKLVRELSKLLIARSSVQGF